MPQDRMADYIETQNIAYFKAQLETETHPNKRKMLIELLAHEEAKRGKACTNTPVNSLGLGQQSSRSAIPRGGKQKHWIKIKNRKHPAMQREF